MLRSALLALGCCAASGRYASADYPRRAPCPSDGTCDNHEYYDNPWSRDDPLTFTGEKYDEPFFCLPERLRYAPTASDWLFERFSRRHYDKGFVFERNVWDSQDVVTEVARILLVERLGYPVRVVTEYDTSELYTRLRDKAFDFNMEVWRNVKAKIDAYDEYIGSTDYASLHDLGSIGYDGREGWYMRTDVLANSSLEDALGGADGWELLRRYSMLNDASVLEALPHSSSFTDVDSPTVFSPNCADNTTPCGTVLMPSDGWSAHTFMRQQIREGNLSIDLLYTGGTRTLWNNVGVPGTMFYWWEPENRVQASDNLIRVEFDSFHYCKRNGESVTRARMPSIMTCVKPPPPILSESRITLSLAHLRCDFTFNDMHKAGNSHKIIKTEPWDLVQHVAMSFDDMESALLKLLNEVLRRRGDDAESGGGSDECRYGDARVACASPREVACDWLLEHEAAWEAWAPRDTSFERWLLHFAYALFALALAWILWPLVGSSWGNTQLASKAFLRAPAAARAAWRALRAARGGGGAAAAHAMEAALLLAAEGEEARARALGWRALPARPGDDDAHADAGGVSFIARQVYCHEGGGDSRAGEEEGFVDVDLMRTTRLDEAAYVEVGTEDGTAKAGASYEPVREVVRFAAGERLARVRVPLKDNEGWFVFALSLSRLPSCERLSPFPERCV